MKFRSDIPRFLRALCLPALYLAALTSGIGASTNVFLTQFEPGEGYSTTPDLIGQGGWLGEGTGGNGIVSNFIIGQGQQAYIGYAAPKPGEDYSVIYHPLNFNPLAAGLPIVKFSVLMNIIDSQPTTNTNRDVFRWSVYNTQTNRLFSIAFDNVYADITYQLDGTNEVQLTDLPFINGSNYTLNVTMNFAANSWSASYNSIPIKTNQPITTTGASLDLGDIDAEWLIYDTDTPGNNYMLFDNYRVTAEGLPVAPVQPAQLELLGITEEGWALLRVFGQTNSRWAVEATTNLVNWTTIKTEVVSEMYVDMVDQTAVGLPRRYYRARNEP